MRGPVIIVRPPSLLIPAVQQSQPAGISCDRSECWATVHTFTITSTAWFQVALVDPTRRRIGFCTTTGEVTVSTVAIDKTGFVIKPGGIVWLKQNDAGQLVEFDWFAMETVIAFPNDVLTVYEIWD